MKELIEPYYLRLLPPDTTEDKLPETIIRQMAEAQGANEKPKGQDHMAWVDMNKTSSACLRSFYAKTGREEGNGRGTRIWLDQILKSSIGQVVDWSCVDKEDFLPLLLRWIYDL